MSAKAMPSKRPVAAADVEAALADARQRRNIKYYNSVMAKLARFGQLDAVEQGRGREGRGAPSARQDPACVRSLQSGRARGTDRHDKKGAGRQKLQRMTLSPVGSDLDYAA